MIDDHKDSTNISTHLPTILPSKYPTLAIPFPTHQPTTAIEWSQQLKNNTFLYPPYKKWVVEPTFSDSEPPLIQSYCTHFLNVKIDQHCSFYDIIYTLDTDIVYNYYHDPKFAQLMNINIDDEYQSCLTKYPLVSQSHAHHDQSQWTSQYHSNAYDDDIGNGISFGHKTLFTPNNIDNVIVNSSYWIQRFRNKTIFMIGDFLLRRLGYQLESLIKNKTDIHQDVAVHNTKNIIQINDKQYNLNIYIFWKQCISNLMQFTQMNKQELLNMFDFNSIKIDLNKNKFKIGYVVSIVGHHNLCNLCPHESKEIENLFNFQSTSDHDNQSAEFKIDNWDLMQWHKIANQLFQSLKLFVKEILKSKLFVLSPIFIDPRRRDYTISNGFEWQSLVKQACLINNIPIVDIYQWTQDFE